MHPSGLYIFLCAADATKVLLINYPISGLLGRTIQTSDLCRVREEFNFKMARLPNHTSHIFGTFEHYCRHLLVAAAPQTCTV